MLFHEKTWFFHEKTCQARAMHLQAFVSLGSYLHCSKEDIKTEKVEVDEDQYDADDAMMIMMSRGWCCNDADCAAAGDDDVGQTAAGGPDERGGHER